MLPLLCKRLPNRHMELRTNAHGQTRLTILSPAKLFVTSQGRKGNANLVPENQAIAQQQQVPQPPNTSKLFSCKK